MVKSNRRLQADASCKKGENVVCLTEKMFKILYYETKLWLCLLPDFSNGALGLKEKKFPPFHLVGHIEFFDRVKFIKF